jgi:hypothetical protein
MPRFSFLTGDGIDRLPVFGLTYLRHVVAEYRISELALRTEPPAVTSLLSKFDATPNDMTWSELFLLEKYILGRQSFPALRRRAWMLRSKYKEIAGASEYDAYEKSNPPNENAVCPEGQEKEREQELRSDLDRVLSAVHWNYSLTPIRERYRGHIVKTTSLLLGIWLIVVGGLSSLCFWYDQVLVGTLLLVMFAGATGGFVSLQRRVQSIPTDGDPLYSIFQLENGLTSVYLSPLSGAIFAVVLFLIFLANLVGGMIFPKVTGFDFQLGAVGWKAIPPTEPAVEYAKLMVWSFIAGFAERFVPDALDRLVNRGKDAMAAPAASPAVVTGTGDGTATGGLAGKIKGLNLPGKGDPSGTGTGTNGNAEEPHRPEDANGKP